jgi:hypothetical protein
MTATLQTAFGHILISVHPADLKTPVWAIEYRPGYPDGIYAILATDSWKSTYHAARSLQRKAANDWRSGR